MSSIVAPEFSLKSFTCPHCGVCSQFHEQLVPRNSLENKRIHLDEIPFGAYDIKIKPTDFFDFFDQAEYLVKICAHCGKVTLWEKRQMIYPYGTSIQPSEYMPETIANIFREAQSITNLSPRAACALLRVCLEKLATQAGGYGGTLSQKVKSLGLSPRMKKLADACRLPGNEAMHGDYFDLGIPEDELKDNAYAISGFINRLTEEFFGLEVETNEIIEKMNEVKKLRDH